MGTLANDLVMATLLKPFPAAKLAKAGATALIGAITDAITTQTCIDHTVQDMDEETTLWLSRVGAYASHRHASSLSLPHGL